MVIICVVASLAAPLDKAMGYFKVTAALFSIVNTSAYYGILMSIINSGPTPVMQLKDPQTGNWEPVYW
tara:strand:+ start:421 stop:624 length:204 start_codon:yes stop_codon:yes gene_type:complete